MERYDRPARGREQHSMPGIHSSAVVETDSIGEGVAIGEFSIVRPGAVIGDGVVILPHVIIDAGVEIGAGTEIQPGGYVGRRPRAAGAVTREPTYEERLRIGAGCAIGAHVVVYYDVEIGDDTLVGDHASIREETRIGSGCAIGRMAGIDREVRIEDGSVVMYGCNVTGKTTVGKNVFLAPGVFTTNDNSMGAGGFEKTTGTLIEDEARIGANAVLLPDVTIGRGAVVGANAVVTHDVAAGARVMGVPAKPV